MAASKDDPRSIKKMMSLTYGEFLRSIAVLSGSKFTDEPQEGRTVTLATGQGHVEIQFKKFPDTRLGGLLNLPQAEVTLRFFDLDRDEAQEFVEKFDQAFQRGGG